MLSSKLPVTLQYLFGLAQAQNLLNNFLVYFSADNFLSDDKCWLMELPTVGRLHRYLAICSLCSGVWPYSCCWNHQYSARIFVLWRHVLGRAEQMQTQLYMCKNAKKRFRVVVSSFSYTVQCNVKQCNLMCCNRNSE